MLKKILIIICLITVAVCFFFLIGGQVGVMEKDEYLAKFGQNAQAAEEKVVVKEIVGKIDSVSLAEAAGFITVSVKMESGEILMGSYDDESYENCCYISPDQNYKVTLTKFMSHPFIKIQPVK